MAEKTRFELFKEIALEDLDAHRTRMEGDGTFCYVKQVVNLIRLQNKISSRMMIYLFGEDLGGHLIEKYAVECRGNLLVFFSRLTDEYRFFILYELKHNASLMVHE